MISESHLRRDLAPRAQELFRAGMTGCTDHSSDWGDDDRHVRVMLDVRLSSRPARERELCRGRKSNPISKEAFMAFGQMIEDKRSRRCSNTAAP